MRHRSKLKVYAAAAGGLAAAAGALLYAQNRGIILSRAAPAPAQPAQVSTAARRIPLKNVTGALVPGGSPVSIPLPPTNLFGAKWDASLDPAGGYGANTPNRTITVPGMLDGSPTQFVGLVTAMNPVTEGTRTGSTDRGQVVPLDENFLTDASWAPGFQISRARPSNLMISKSGQGEVSGPSTIGLAPTPDIYDISYQLPQQKKGIASVARPPAQRIIIAPKPGFAGTSPGATRLGAFISPTPVFETDDLRS